MFTWCFRHRRRSRRGVGSGRMFFSPKHKHDIWMKRFWLSTFPIFNLLPTLVFGMRCSKGRGGGGVRCCTPLLISLSVVCKFLFSVASFLWEHWLGQYTLVHDLQRVEFVFGEPVEYMYYANNLRFIFSLAN